MNELDRDLVFSQSVKAGKRIYYFDVKQSKNGDRYISITESKKIVEGSYENPRVSFEKHKLFLYKEDYEKFIDAFVKTLKVAKTGVLPEEELVITASESAEQESEVKTDSEPVEDAPVTNEVAPEPEPVKVEMPVAEPPVSEVKDKADAYKIDLDF